MKLSAVVTDFFSRLSLRILDRYLLRTFISPFLAGVGFLSMIIMIFYLKEVIKAAVEKGIPFFMVVKLMLYSIGWTLGLTVPMSSLLAMIIAIGALNSDSEIIAMRASGITFGRIFSPFFRIGILITVFMLWFNQQLVPYCLNQVSEITAQIYSYDPVAIIEPGQFTQLDKSDQMIRHIYIESIVKDSKSPDYGKMKNIQIRKLERIGGVFRVTELITARNGEKISKYKGNKLTRALRLKEGYIFSRSKDGKSFQRIDYNHGYLDLNILELGQAAVGRYDKMDGYSLTELRRAIKQEKSQVSAGRKNQTLQLLTLEFHKRLARPFATLFFMVLGFPLGVVNRRASRSSGLGISIFFILLYYIIYLSADTMVLGVLSLSPVLAAWLANLVILALGIYFYRNRLAETGFRQNLARLWPLPKR